MAHDGEWTHPVPLVCRKKPSCEEPKTNHLQADGEVVGIVRFRVVQPELQVTAMIAHPFFCATAMEHHPMGGNGSILYRLY